MSASGSRVFDVWFRQSLAGKLSVDPAMRMHFVYDETYRQAQSPAISLTMPTTSAQHDDKVVFPFIENLLPEGEIRSLIQRQNKIEDGNFARFIELLGGDVAGAISIQPEGSVPVFQSQSLQRPLDRPALSRLLLDIQDRPFNASAEGAAAGNRLSLAGAQNKLPVICNVDRIFETAGAPSTHIIKPARKDGRFPSIVYNEYLCMKAAKRAGLDVAEVVLLEVDDVRGNESDALLVTRYDRVVSGDVVERLQQEDLCQLCSLPSTIKYETSGGPGFRELFAAIARYSRMPVKDDVEVFRRMIFNLVIGNYDAHAKNFSFLVAADGKVALAPAYDLICTALYAELDQTFAMSIGEAKTLEQLSQADLVRLFSRVQKKYPTIRRQLQKFCTASMQAVADTVNEFAGMDFYPADIEAAGQLVRIANANGERVLAAI
jgi:serine/threonine-protein kinase HipA